MRSPELRLDCGNPMAAGCEGNSVPEAIGCDPSLCQGLLDAAIAELVDVHWWSGALLGLHNSSLAKEVGGRKISAAPLPS